VTYLGSQLTGKQPCRRASLLNFHVCDIFWFSTDKLFYVLVELRLIIRRFK